MSKSELDAQWNYIETIEEAVRAKQDKLLREKHRWLELSGWTIKGDMPPHFIFNLEYSKKDRVTFCPDHAIEIEKEGLFNE